MLPLLFAATLPHAGAAHLPSAEPWGVKPVASDHSLAAPITIWCDFGSIAHGTELLARLKWRESRASA